MLVKPNSESYGSRFDTTLGFKLAIYYVYWPNVTPFWTDLKVLE